MNDYLLDKFNKIEDTHWWWEGRRRLVKNLLRKRNVKRILDVGCGTGETLSFLNKLYPKAKLFGVDTSSKAVRMSKARGHTKIFKAYASNMPFRSNYFDTILFLDVLEHIKDDQSVINEAKRVLKRGGVIIITSPGLSFIWSDHDVNQGHKRRYTRREIIRIAGNSGLKTVFIKYFNFWLSPPIIFIRLISRVGFFKFLVNYNNGINFEVVKIGPLNSILRYIFVNEIETLKYLTYPLGVSISAVLKKVK